MLLVTHKVRAHVTAVFAPSLTYAYDYCCTGDGSVYMYMTIVVQVMAVYICI